jgi:hypothetical protein
MNEHTREKHAKCAKCKKVFGICQNGSHGSGAGSRGYRICFRPCYCGPEFYPVNARSATELQPHEYMPDHPGFRPEESYDPSMAADSSTISFAATDLTTSDHSVADYTPYGSAATVGPPASYTAAAYTSAADYPTTEYPAVAYTSADPTATNYAAVDHHTATYRPAHLPTAATYPVHAHAPANEGPWSRRILS